MTDNVLKVVSDLYKEDVFYVKTKVKKYARLEKRTDGWHIYFYEYKFSLKKQSLNEALRAVNNSFIRYKKNEILNRA